MNWKCLSKNDSRACLLGTFLFGGMTGCRKLATLLMHVTYHMTDRGPNNNCKNTVKSGIYMWPVTCIPCPLLCALEVVEASSSSASIHPGTKCKAQSDTNPECHVTCKIILNVDSDVAANSSNDSATTEPNLPWSLQKMNTSPLITIMTISQQCVIKSTSSHNSHHITRC